METLYRLSYRGSADQVTRLRRRAGNPPWVGNRASIPVLQRPERDDAATLREPWFAQAGRPGPAATAAISLTLPIRGNGDGAPG